MRIILRLLLALLTPTVWACDQLPDIVRLDGRKYALRFEIRSNALSIYDCKDHKVLPFPPPHTACWRGYVGMWEIRDGTLLLVGLETFDKDGNKVTNRFTELFPGHQTGLDARWFTGVLRLAEPNCYGFACDPPDMTFEQEVHVEVVEGRVRSCRHVDNRVKVREALKKGLEETERKYRQPKAQVNAPHEPPPRV